MFPRRREKKEPKVPPILVCHPNNEYERSKLIPFADVVVGCRAVNVFLTCFMHFRRDDAFVDS